MATKTVVVGVRMTRKLAATLRRMASDSSMTRSEFLTALIDTEAARRANIVRLQATADRGEPFDKFGMNG